MSLIQVSCPLCGLARSRVLHEDFARPFEARLTTNVYGGFGRVVCCRSCGLVYRSPRESFEVIEAAYRGAADPEALWEGECRSINAYLSLRVIRRYLSEGRLLELGSSLGHFLDAARSTFESVGLELNSWSARKARELYGVQVIEEKLRPGLFEAASFDVVVAIDVLEHLTDPREDIQNLASFLKPGGILYLVTPNVCSLSAKVLGRWWWGFRPAHLTYFSPDTLQRLLSETGFTVRQCRSYGRVFSYAYWLSRLRNYPGWMVQPLWFLFRFLGWSGKVLYLDTRDSMEVVAVKS